MAPKSRGRRALSSSDDEEVLLHHHAPDHHRPHRRPRDEEAPLDDDFAPTTIRKGRHISGARWGIAVVTALCLGVFVFLVNSLVGPAPPAAAAEGTPASGQESSSNSVEVSSVSSSTSNSPSESSSASSTAGGATASGTASTSGPGLFDVTDERCGPSGATQEVTKDAGPNGAASWLTCGLSEENKDAKWTPPKVELSQIAYVDLDEAMKNPNSPFKPCTEYIPLFKSIGASTGLPPILLASFAMTESTCRADVVGDHGGAFGLMQITEDKCGGAPNGKCDDPEFNVRTGAEYFKSELERQNGDLLSAIGQYNGWTANEITYASATRHRQDHCQWQNNLDYLHVTLNGRLQAIPDAEISKLLLWNNLAECGT